VLLHSDMAEAARAQCVALTYEALVRYKTEKDQAMHVKLALEDWNGALWMVIIGQAFGASVAHDNHGLLMFRVGRVHVLCFQAYDEGALINTKKESHAKKAVAKKDEDEAAAE